MAQNDINTATRTTSTLFLTPTEPQILAVMRDWLMDTLPSGWALEQDPHGDESSPEPPFATVKVVTRERTATNAYEYGKQTVTIIQPLIMGIQITLFGAGAGDAAVQLNTVWCDDDAVTFFRRALPQTAPLYGTNPRQNAVMTAKQNDENIWSIDLMLNVNTQIIRPVESAIELNIPAKSVIKTDIVTSTTEPQS
ncbi:hypothetical protein GS501_04990 [Saccharibacter sp. 17.LH.SD]|uniref:phage neck terminator protein n=1 Tax=Saccharibacter sp. 17.LH.SD TaxID=2689393 RepID=UPI00136E6D5C|nr:hypothetical protein [Saccharibacter sp. 17.LH.SD]MXV44403.1 hypothetical protein [Saccharibacter sp. 17.LH.SD]